MGKFSLTIIQETAPDGKGIGDAVTHITLEVAGQLDERTLSHPNVLAAFESATAYLQALTDMSFHRTVEMQEAAKLDG